MTETTIGNGYTLIDRRADLPRLAPYPRRDLSLVKWLAIHHTGVSGDQSADSIARYHTSPHGPTGEVWPGIGYHVLVHPDGLAELCNDLDRACYNVAYRNAEVIGVCIVGDFTHEPPIPEALATAHEVVRHLQWTLGWFCPAAAHRDIADPRSPTACPGDTYLDWLPQVQVLKPAPDEVLSPAYKYVLGFADLGRDLKGAAGEPLDDEYRDSLMVQHTSTGIMLYRDDGQPHFYQGPIKPEAD